MIRAGALTKRAAFSAPFKETDANGKRIQRYDHQFTIWANVRHLRGGESVMQARLVSRSPAIVTVRAFAGSRRITSEWRIVIDSRTYDVKEDPRETQDRAFLELLAECVG